MIQDFKTFIIFGAVAIGAFVLMRLVYGENRMLLPQLVTYVIMVSIMVFTKSLWLVFIFIFLLKMIYLHNDIRKNANFFIFLYALVPINAVVPFLNPGSLYFLDLNLQRVMSVVLLLPLIFPLRRMGQEKEHWFKLDLVFLGLVAIFTYANFRARSGFDVTTFFSIREMMGFFMDAVIPYFVLSRTVQSFGALRQFSKSLVFGGLIVVFAALIEVALNWKFILDLVGQMAPYRLEAIDTMYEWRGGILRATSSLVHPITLGFYVSIVLGFTLFLFVSEKVNIVRRVILVAPLLLVILSTGSRGAWVGVALLISASIFFQFRRGFRKFLLVQVIVLGGGLAFLSLNPAKFSMESGGVANYDQHGTFEYRAKLAEASLKVIPQNPWFGTREYEDNPIMEELRQGQGIIDMVNGYVHISVEFGLLTLGLFVLMMIRGLLTGSAWVLLGEESGRDDWKFVGVALISILLSLAIQFAFTSFVGFIYAWLWIMFALARNFRYVLEETAMLDPSIEESDQWDDENGLGRA